MRYSLAILLAVLLVGGCIKDTLVYEHTYTLATPVYKTTESVRNDIKNIAPIPISAPGKMYVQGSYIFLAESGKGIHIINNSNPANPVNEAFVKIPGCEDMAVYGNTLYADCYTDLMVIDISNPKAVQLKTFVSNLFPDRRVVMGYRVDSNHVIADWMVRDTTVIEKRDFSNGRFFGTSFWFDSRAEFATSQNSGFRANAASPAAGRGGSMARFAITHQHLYTVTISTLHALSLQQPEKPALKSTTQLPWGIETIYPFKDKLFIGANSGMHIYTISNPSKPQQAGTFTHARVCDPVIADDNYAYVTLRSGSTCFGFINQLDVVDVRNIFSPRLIKTYPLTNPHGLDKVGNTLFVCDGKDGLKILDATQPHTVTVQQTIAVKDAYDVICWNGVAMVSAADGLHQFDISNVNSIKKLSFLGLLK